MGSCRP
nr:unnamed protein product [Callosobruchus chinensis]